MEKAGPPTDTILHGFEDPDFVDEDVLDEFRNEFSGTLLRRQARWQESMNNNIDRSRKLKRFCRKGIPPSRRSEIWMLLSGAAEELSNNPDIYKSVLAANANQTVLDQIKADIPRTFPENIYYRNPAYPQTKLHSLERVLTAFANHSPNVGYCQGFNYITAILLLVVQGETEEENEAKAFWLLDSLVNHILPTYYSSGMVDLRTDCRVLGELLRLKIPALYQRIVDLGASFDILVTKWFICLYIDVLPIETSLRVLDCLFYEGDKILFRTGLALIQVHSDQLRKCEEFPDLMTTFRQMCLDKHTLRCNEFLKLVFNLKGGLSRRQIKKLRIAYKREIQVGKK